MNRTILESYELLLPRHPGAGVEEWEGGLLWGPSGVGKTRLAFERARSVGASIVKAYRYLELAIAVAADRADEDEAGLFRLFPGMIHLVLDDLGTRPPSDFAYETIYRLLDARADANCSTLVTCNLPPQILVNIYDERILSRILCFGPAKELTGEDRRLGRPQFLRRGGTSR